MKKSGDQFETNTKQAGQTSVEQTHTTALQCVLVNNEEELLWLAEVMAGTRPAGGQCLAEAIALAEEAKYVRREWMLSWVRRLLVHVALNRISGEIRELLPLAGTGTSVPLSGAHLSTVSQQELRLIPPQKFVDSFDVLERTCLVLYVYLQYPLLDCALLLGCPRAWIEPVCAGVLSKIADAGTAAQDGFSESDPFISSGVPECAG